MTAKEWTAVIQLVGGVLIGGWLALDLAATGVAQLSFADAAVRLLWTMGALIAFNILAFIVVAILVAIFTREELKDEAADERDRWVGARGMRNSGIVQSVAAVAVLFALAFGAEPALAVLALFFAPLLGGLTDAASRLVYYRVG